MPWRCGAKIHNLSFPFPSPPLSLSSLSFLFRAGQTWNRAVFFPTSTNNKVIERSIKGSRCVDQFRRVEIIVDGKSFPRNAFSQFNPTDLYPHALINGRATAARHQTSLLSNHGFKTGRVLKFSFHIFPALVFTDPRTTRTRYLPSPSSPPFVQRCFNGYRFNRLQNHRHRCIDREISLPFFRLLVRAELLSRVTILLLLLRIRVIEPFSFGWTTFPLLIGSSSQ